MKRKSMSLLLIVCSVLTVAGVFAAGNLTGNPEFLLNKVKETPPDGVIPEQVVCTPPWQSAQFQQNNMSVIAKLYLSGVVSTNAGDAVGAFVGTECRGIGHPDPSLGGMIFLTITSNAQSGETVTFKSWNSSTCQECTLTETMAFVAQSEAGTMANPFLFHCECAPALSVSPASRNVSNTAGTTTFAIANTGCGTLSWTASSNQTWCTLSPASGTGNATLTATCTANTTCASRTATITITSTGATGSPATVTITQQGLCTAQLTIGTVSGIAGGSVHVPVTASGLSDVVGFQFTIDFDHTKLVFVNTTNWGGGADSSNTALVITPKSNGKVTFVYNGNPVNISSGKFFDLNFTISTGSAGNVSVSWSDDPTPRELSNSVPEIIPCTYTNGGIIIPGSCMINVTPTSRSVPDSPGGSVSFSVSSDCVWTATSDQLWCAVSPSDGSGNQILTANYTENLTGSTRTATISVTATITPGYPVNITVVQSSVATLTLYFNSGWNIFSTNKLPGETDLKSIFLPLINEHQLVKIQDENGNSLEDLGVFGGWTNKIGDILLTEGYKIKATTACQLSITGAPVQLPYAIPLKAGWNIMGFPKETAAEGLGVLQQLIDRGVLVKVQDENGNAIEDMGVFGGWQNYIGDFKPGKGYKIKISANDILTIY